MIAPEGFKMITRHLYEHPEGVMHSGFTALEQDWAVFRFFMRLHGVLEICVDASFHVTSCIAK